MATNMESAVGDVRADEQLAWSKIEAHLKAQLPGLDGPMEPLQFLGGHANLTYLLRFKGRDLVLRRPPLGPVGVGAHDMGREHKVLSRLNDAFKPAPRAFLYCDESLIGAPFFIMERREGVVVRDEIPAPLSAFENVDKRISFALVDAMAEMHRVDPDAVGLGELGRPNGFVERQLKGWHRRWQDAKDVEIPLFEEIHRKLAATIPSPPRVSILHNDLKLDNCQFEPDNPDQVQSVFDWDMATLGDPLIDLGTLLAYWSDPSEEAIASQLPQSSSGGFPSKSEIVARYASQINVDPATIAWYEAFAFWKTAVVLQQIYIRFKRGQTKDERFAEHGTRVPKCLDAAQETLASTFYG
jgi:aminoglycoside phosphotransferase (APT) family kinase protein